MRATPLSRASSRNTNYDDLHSEVDSSEVLSVYCTGCFEPPGGSFSVSCR